MNIFNLFKNKTKICEHSFIILDEQCSYDFFYGYIETFWKRTLMCEKCKKKVKDYSTSGSLWKYKARKPDYLL